VLANSVYNGNLNTIPSPVALVTSNEAAQIALLTAPLASLWPEVVLSNDVSHTFTIAGVKYTAPSSVSAGLNEIAAMFPINTNRAASGYKVRLGAGEYDIQGAIWDTNNGWIEGAGGLATIIRYTGTTNGWTQQAVQTACSNTVTYCGLLNVYGNPASFPGGTVMQAPNVVLKGFTILPATNMWCADMCVNAFNCVADDVWVGGPQLGGGPDYYNGFVELNTITNASKVVGIITFGTTHMRFNDCYCVATADGVYHAGNTYNYDDGIQGFFVGNWSNAGSQTWGNAYASNTELSLGFLVGTSQAGNIYYSSVRRLMPYKCRVDVYNGAAAVMSIGDFVDQYGQYPIGCFAFPPFIHAQSQIENLTSYAPYAVTNDTSGNWNIDSTRLVKLAVPSISSIGGDRIFSSGNVPYIELWDTNSYSNNGAGSNAVIIQGGIPLIANGVGVTNIQQANITGPLTNLATLTILTNAGLSYSLTNAGFVTIVIDTNPVLNAAQLVGTIPAAAGNGVNLTNLQLYPLVTNNTLNSSVWVLTTNASMAVTWWLATNNLPYPTGGGGGSGNASTNNAATQYWPGVQALTNTANALAGNGLGITNLNTSITYEADWQNATIGTTGGNEYWPLQNAAGQSAGFGSPIYWRKVPPGVINSVWCNDAATTVSSANLCYVFWTNTVSATGGAANSGGAAMFTVTLVTPGAGYGTNVILNQVVPTNTVACWLLTNSSASSVTGFYGDVTVSETTTSH